MTDCIFCKIVNKEIPAKIVYEDENSLAFLDIQPANKGHTLVIPKYHAENIYDIPEDNLKGLVATVKRVSQGVKDALDPKGLNIIQNNDTAAGQVIFHIHFHVVPRNPADGNEIKFNNLELGDEEQMKIAKRIRESIHAPRENRKDRIEGALDKIDNDLKRLDDVLK